MAVALSFVLLVSTSVRAVLAVLMSCVCATVIVRAPIFHVGTMLRLTRGGWYPVVLGTQNRKP